MLTSSRAAGTSMRSSASTCTSRQRTHSRDNGVSMRRFLLTAVLAATAVVVFTTGVAVEDARAGAGLTAVGVRIENRPEAVRIVVRLSGAPLQEAQVFATSRPRKLTLGTARVRIVAPAAGAPLRSGPVSGVLVDVVPKPRELIVRADKLSGPLQVRHLPRAPEPAAARDRPLEGCATQARGEGEVRPSGLLDD